MADHSPRLPSGAVDGVSMVPGGEDLRPESAVPAPGEGQETLSQMMSQLMASLPVMVPWRLKATRSKMSTASAPKPMDTEADKSKQPKSYAAVTKGTSPDLLCIHLGKEEHGYINESLFSRLNMLYSFQVKSENKAGMERRGWYCHVRILKKMKDKIIQLDSKLDLLLWEISVSFSGKIFLDHKTEESQPKASRAKPRKAVGRIKRAEENKSCPEPAGGKASQKVVAPPLVPPNGTENRDKVAEALKEGTPTTVPGRQATPIPVRAGAGKQESVSDVPHILTGEEYWHFQLLKKQEANRKCKQPVGISDGLEKTAKQGPGQPQGSRSKGQVSGAGQSGDTETSIQKYLS